MAKTTEKTTTKKHSHFREVVQRMSYSKINIVCFIIVMIYFLVAIFAPVIAPYGYEEMIARSLQPPSAEHWFGTDDLGRDYFSRVIYGTRYSVFMGFAAQIFSLVLGGIFGAIAGYYGGKIDEIFMRICDVFQSIPGTLLNMALCVAFGTGFFNTIVALGIGGVAGSARMMRVSFLKLRKAEFIDAARAIDCSDPKIIMKHMLPNAFAPVLVSTTMGIGGTIMSAAGLSFLGLGVQAPTPEWGALLSGGRNFIRKAPWICIFPGLFILILVLSLNLLGDGLRDALDPRLKK